MTERVFAWPCPNPFACLGGTNLGNGSCATGHAGLLCGFCAEGFYRKRTGCDSCISGSSTAGPMIVWILTFFVLIAIVAGSIIYMYRGARLDLAPAQREAPMNQRADQLQKKTQFDRFFAIVSLLPKKLVAASTIFRIFFGYVQCLTIVLRFTNVVWPPGFVSFVKVLEYFTIDIFTMLPIACLTGSRLTFTTELMIICMLPIASVLILSVVMLVVAPLAGHAHSCRGFTHVLNGLIHRAELWDLILFFFLFEYQIVARKSVSAFDCVDLGDGRSVLTEDTSILCGESEWSSSAMIAFAAIAFFGLGLPLATWFISRTGHSGTAAHRRLVHVLTWIYEDNCASMESVDLIRKFLLTGVVCIAYRDERAQVWAE